MKLEEAIKQKKFESEHHRSVLNILYTASWLLSRQNEVFKEYSITQPQYNILRILRGQHPKPATVNMLIDRMLDKSSNASRIVERLRKKGLIDRRECEEDRRAVDVFITKKGLQLLEKIGKEGDRLMDGIKNLTQQEAKQLGELLDKVRD